MYDLCPPRCLLLFFYVTFQRYFLIYYKLSQILAHTHISVTWCSPHFHSGFTFQNCSLPPEWCTRTNCSGTCGASSLPMLFNSAIMWNMDTARGESRASVCVCVFVSIVHCVYEGDSLLVWQRDSNNYTPFTPPCATVTTHYKLHTHTH